MLVEWKVGFLSLVVSEEQGQHYHLQAGDMCQWIPFSERKGWECTIETVIHQADLKRYLLFLSISQDFIQQSPSDRTGDLVLVRGLPFLFQAQRDFLSRFAEQLRRSFAAKDHIIQEGFNQYSAYFHVSDPEFEEQDNNPLNDSILPQSAINGIAKIKELVESTSVRLQKNEPALDRYQGFGLSVLEKLVAQSDSLCSQDDCSKRMKLVWGPPGTGKTYLISKLTNKLLQLGKRILLTSFTHIAIDNVLEHVLKDPANQMDIMCRYGDSHKIRVPAVKQISCGTDFFRVSKARLVGATLDAVLLDRWQLFEEGNSRFDAVIIDEASMAAFPKVLNAFAKAKTLILVGDFMQLVPFDSLEGAAYHEFKSVSTFSYFSYMAIRILTEFSRQELLPPYDQIPLIPLFINRRSFPGIFRYSNDKFYCGYLKATRNPKELNRISGLSEGLQEIFQNNGDKPVWLNPAAFRRDGKSTIPVDHKGSIRSVSERVAYSNPGRCSYVNPCQLALTLQVTFHYLHSFCRAEGITAINQIGIIALFRLHTLVLRTWLWENASYFYKLFGIDIQPHLGSDILSTAIANWMNLLFKHWVVENLEVGTVEKFQGREKKIIISNTVYHPAVAKTVCHPAFVDPRRLNVILTRARDRHILISRNFDPHEGATFYSDLLDLKERSSIYIPCKGFFKHITDGPIFSFETLYTSEDRKLAGSIVKSIEATTGGKVAVGGHDGLTVNYNMSGSAQLDIGFILQIEGAIDQVASSFIKADRKSDQKVLDRSKDFVKYICNFVHRKNIEAITKDPQAIKLMGEKCDRILHDSSLKDLVRNEAVSMLSKKSSTVASSQLKTIEDWLMKTLL
jgi:hypothetical protein